MGGAAAVLAGESASAVSASASAAVAAVAGRGCLERRSFEGAGGVGVGEILLGDNLDALRAMASGSVGLIYIDPPFNTGKRQSRKNIRVRRVDDDGDSGVGGDYGDGGVDSAGDSRNSHNNGSGGRSGDSRNNSAAISGRRVGFGGRVYASRVAGESGYADSFDDYPGFLRPRLQEAHRVLRADGSLFFHIDWREAARCRLLLEEVFGGARHCINEIIWAYDFGGRGKNRWPAKHDNIYWFAKNPADYIFNYGDIDRIPYMSPSLVGKEKAARGKTPTDTWWNTIVPTNGAEKANYATQKPLAILNRIVRVHSNPGDTVLDFFAGSGTAGVAAARNGRRFVLVDCNPKAFETMQTRLREEFCKCEKNNKEKKK